LARCTGKVNVVKTTGRRSGQRHALNALPEPEQLVGLQAQSPTGISEAVCDGSARVIDDLRSVHRLQKKVLEVERFERLRRRAILRKDELELITARNREWCAGFGTDAN